jgi:hypothetical protein
MSLISVISLNISASVSFFTALEAFFDPRGLWISFNKTLWALHRIKDDLEYKAARQEMVSSNELDALYQRLQDLLVEANATWADKRERATNTGQNAKAT